MLCKAYRYKIVLYVHLKDQGSSSRCPACFLSVWKEQCSERTDVQILVCFLSLLKSQKTFTNFFFFLLLLVNYLATQNSFPHKPVRKTPCQISRTTEIQFWVPGSRAAYLFNLFQWELHHFIYPRKPKNGCQVF